MIEFQQQYSYLNRFVGVDPDTGELLPEQVWSDKVWATEFSDGLALKGLALSWKGCMVYLQGRSYAIPAGSHVFGADPIYATSVIVWLDPTSIDNLTIDEVLLDGLHESPAAPAVVGDFLRLAWGTVGARATEMTLHALRHVAEV